MDRFWNKVIKTESCWIWTANKHPNGGYGRFKYKGKYIPAHRFVWLLTYGEWPNKGTDVLHKCDNPSCVNPDHLCLEDDPENFWSKVNKTESCWEWTRQKQKGFSYGKLTYKNKKRLAHRVSWFLTYGEWPSNNMCVLHKCDNPSCVNPDHLFLGTQQDNMRDMAIKNRAATKLKPEEVIEIRKLAELGESRKVLSEKFNISKRQINRIISREDWRHIE